MSIKLQTWCNLYINNMPFVKKKGLQDYLYIIYLNQGWWWRPWTVATIFIGRFDTVEPMLWPSCQWRDQIDPCSTGNRFWTPKDRCCLTLGCHQLDWWKLLAFLILIFWIDITGTYLTSNQFKTGPIWPWYWINGNIRGWGRWNFLLNLEGTSK